MSDLLAKLSYQAFQQGKSYFALAHKSLSSQVLRFLSPPSESRAKSISTELLLKLQKRLEEVNDIDWQDAERGVYPSHLLFDNEWDNFLQYYPAMWVDMFASWERAKQKRYQDFSEAIDTSNYPSYYVQNFHHQTDGYLSDWSANLYDVQVDVLFNGTANAMRRRVLAPLKKGIQTFSSAKPQQIRVLDVACGTGRTLKFIRAALPKASLYGVDLSPAYLRRANQLLSQLPGELPQLIQANAEELPYQDEYFHGLTCVFLFHELPPAVRQNVINECFRVTKPGGIFVICDSIQLSDSPDMAPMMENFASMFHEPYYRHYIADDLIARLQTAGFTQVTEEVHFMSKYFIAQKPTSPIQEAKQSAERTLSIHS